jgi:cobaltochelatase CobS
MDLIGQFTLIEGETRFTHGPLARALQEGHILVLNELDLMEPSELSGLNDCLEGDGLTISQNGGERIHPHPAFRLIATANSAGQGDRTGLYQGVLRQNLALMDRFRLMEVDYPAPEFELALLKSQLPELPETLLSQLIRVAGEIRQLFVGRDHQKGLLTLTLSTRGLLRWAHLTWAFRSAPQALEYALERALTFRADPDQKIAIHRIAADVLGDQWIHLSFPQSPI